MIKEIRRSRHWLKSSFRMDNTIGDRPNSDEITKKDCAQRAQTFANAKISTKSNPGFQSELPDYSGSGCLPDLSQNVVDSLSCRHQSFRQVS